MIYFHSYDTVIFFIYCWCFYEYFSLYFIKNVIS